MQTSEPKASNDQLRTLELSPRQVHLLLKYGYPFPDAERPLRESKAENGFHHVSIDAYWIEMMVADLVRSAKKLRSQALLEEIDALCDALEFALDDPPKLGFVNIE